MPSPVTFLMEVKPYIKSYLLTLYGPSEPILFPKKSNYCRFIHQNIQKRPPDAHVDFNREGKVEIQLYYNEFKNILHYNYIGKEGAKKLRNIIKAEFTQDFRDFIKLKIDNGWSRKEATIMFMTLYNISEDDISFSAFYRDYSRQLQKRRLKYCESAF
ncbi:MAG: hypothetical protein ACOYMF_05465 [Bacteroidales bacterium]